jgi:DNA-binding beta-propeller fold protein YncE
MRNRKTIAVLFVAALVATVVPGVLRTAKASVAGAGPADVHFELTDDNAGWFDTGTSVFGTKSLAVAELPRVGLGTLGVSPTDVTTLDAGAAAKGVVAGLRSNPVLQVPGVPPVLDSLATVSTALDTLKPQLDKIGMSALLPEIDKINAELKTAALDPAAKAGGLNTFPVGVDLLKNLNELSTQLADVNLPVKTTFHIGPENTDTAHMVSSLIWPTGAVGFPYDQQGPTIGDLSVDLTKPGLYAFQCKIHPYMLGAVVVDDPLTPGLDFGKSLTVNLRNFEAVPSQSDLIFKLVHTFFKITVPTNWDTYSDTKPTVWDPQYPTGPILTYDSFGNPQLIPNLNDFFHSYFHEPVQQPALKAPAVPGVGDVWVDTEMEQTAHKSKVGTATKIDTSDWSVTRKVALPQVNMNNPHNMWTDAAGKLVYQTEWWSNRLDVFDQVTGKLIRTMPTGPSPSHVMTEVGSDNVDVVINGGNQIMVFSPGATKLLKTINLAPPGVKPADPHAPWMSTDGRFMVTPNVNHDTVSIVDMMMGTSREESSLGHWPIAQGMLPDNSKFYTANFLDGTISCISMTAPACNDNGTLVHSKLIDLQPGYNPVTGSTGAVGLGGIPIQSPVSPDGKTLLIANTFTNNVGVVDTRTDTLVKFLPCDAGCHGINFGFKKGGGYYGYVSSKFANTLEVIDVSNGPQAAEVVGKITVNSRPTTAVDDPIVGYSGFGGMGIFTQPLAYPGWSAAQKAAGAPYTDQLTPCQVAEPGKNAC